MKVPASRIGSLDQMRGLAIILMVVANYIAGIAWIPGWLKHAPDIGFTVIDEIAPLFIVSIGFTFVLSFARHASKDGAQAAYLTAIRRFLSFIGIGAIITAGEQLLYPTDITYQWGVLQAIGAAGLVTLIFISLNKYLRLAIGLLLLAIYQFLLDSFWLQLVLESSHGGLCGSISWAGMLIISTAISELFLERDRKIGLLLVPGLIFLASGIGLSFIFALSKNRVSISYVFITIGISLLLFALFEFLSQRIKLKFEFLVWWGKNPLLLYVCHYILLGFVALPNVKWLYIECPAWLMELEILLLIGILSLIAWKLSKKNLILRI